MNDPHLESLTYTLVPGADTSYRDEAEPVTIETDDFTARLERGALTVTMKDHHSSEDSARAIVDPYLRAWETVEALESGRPEFTFEFAGSQIIDRQPDRTKAGGTAHAIGLHSVVQITSSMHAHVTRGSYPSPPRRPFAVSPAVEMLLARWRLAAEGRDTLLAAAYFCLTAIEFFYGNGNRSRAAATLGVSTNVLQTLGRLTAGGDDPTRARKFDPAAAALSSEETTWIERTIRELILRAGEVAARGDASTLKQLTLADLPPLQ